MKFGKILLTFGQTSGEKNSKKLLDQKLCLEISWGPSVDEFRIRARLLVQNYEKLSSDNFIQITTQLLNLNPKFTESVTFDVV